MNNIFDYLQSVYKATETTLIKITDDILTNLDKNITTVLIMIDMSSAFATTDHKILLNRRLKSFG